ncbi:MAG: hypothetical protein Q7U02_08160, partial [Desulfosalsimonadaceae bacterium]|nr:hypothetical protein [Desulfosalsimonadaceae bacterium]
ELDEWVVMPNHVHGIVVITNIGHVAVGANVRAKNFSPLQSPAPFSRPSSHHPGGASKTIGSIVRGFKIGVTKWIRQNTSIHDVWQRNYWEHVVRNETELTHIREYIRNNPAQWDLDQLFVPFSPCGIG